jgi:hypothetical protein
MTGAIGDPCARRTTTIDWSAAPSKPVEEFLGLQFDSVITVCDRARQTCPIFPSSENTLHWGLDDPAEGEGSDPSGSGVQTDGARAHDTTRAVHRDRPSHRRPWGPSRRLPAELDGSPPSDAGWVAGRVR